MKKRLLIGIVLCVLGLFLPQTIFATGCGETNEVGTTATGSELAEVGWPAHYGGVMLQGFYWESYAESSWKHLTEASDSISKYFDLIWVPNSARLSHDAKGMGYIAHYFFDHSKSSFGTEAELRNMISTYKQKSVGIIEDVVVNHRTGADDYNLFVFPAERWKRRTDDTYNYKCLNENDVYQMKSTDILRDDNGGNTLKSAEAAHVQLSDSTEENYQVKYMDGTVKDMTTESNSAGLDLDHRSENINKIVEAYEEYLIHDLGYAGLRYDVAKGFLPKHIADYNAVSLPRFSVGEVWDQDSTVLHYFIDNWSKKGSDDNKNYHLSAAFDFTLKHQLFNGKNYGDPSFNTGNFSQDANIFKNKGLQSLDPNHSRYSITFTENHDTYYPRDDGSNSSGNELKANVMPANAYILAMPGTPCIYYKHWLDPAMQPNLKKMILGRKAAGVTNMSLVVDDGYDPTDHDGYYAVIKGDEEVDSVDAKYNKVSDGKGGYVKQYPSILLFIGNVNPTNLNGHTIDEYYEVASGENYAFYISKSVKDKYVKAYSDAKKDFTYDDTSKDNVSKPWDTTKNHEPTITTSGKEHNIYVLYNEGVDAPAVHIWDGGGDLTGTYLEQHAMHETTEKYGKKWYTTKIFNHGNYETIGVLLHAPGTDNKGANNENINGDIYLVWDPVNYISTDITDAVVGNGKVLNTVYVKKNSRTAPKIDIVYKNNHVNGEGKTLVVATNTTNFEGGEYYFANVTTTGTNTYDVTLYDENNNKLGTVGGILGDVFLQYDDKSVTDITSQVKGDGSYNYTIYVKQDAGNNADGMQPALHAWVDGGGNLNGDWGDGQKMTEAKEMDGVTYWYKKVVVPAGKVFNVILHPLGKNSKDEDTGLSTSDNQVEFDGLANDVYLTWNPGSGKDAEGKPVTKCSGENITDEVLKDKTFRIYLLKEEGKQVPYANVWWNGGSLGEVFSKTTTRNDADWYYVEFKPGNGKYSFNLDMKPDDNNQNWSDNKYQNIEHDMYISYDPALKWITNLSFKYGVNHGGWRNVTVYVLKNKGEEHGPSLHAWNEDQARHHFGNWNGWQWGDEHQVLTESTEIGDSVYWYRTFEHLTDSIYIKLHDNTTNKESAQFTVNGDIFFSWNKDTGTALDITKAVKGNPNEPGLIDDGQDKLSGEYVARRFTVYFRDDTWDKENQWRGQHLRAYLWNDKVNFTGGWNGENMTYIGSYPEKCTIVEKGEDGKDVKKEVTKNVRYYGYSYVGDMTDVPNKVIFNYYNGVGGTGDLTQKQTADLNFYNNRVYTPDSTASGNATCSVSYVPAKVARDYADKVRCVSHVIFIKDGGWKTAGVRVYSSNDTTYVNGDKSKTDPMYVYAQTNHLLAKTRVRGVDYWVWEYGGDNATTPGKVQFYANGLSIGESQDYREHGAYTYTADNKSFTVADGRDETIFHYLYKRSFTPGKRSTICLPIDLTEGQLNNIGAKVYKFRGVDSKVVRFERVKAVEAGKPYLFVFIGGENAAKTNAFYRTGMTNLAWTWDDNKMTDANDTTVTYDKTLSDNSSLTVTWVFRGNRTAGYKTVTDDKAEGGSFSDAAKAYFGYNEDKDEFIWAENRTAAIPPTVCWFEVNRKAIESSDYTFDSGSTGGTNPTHAKALRIQLLEPGELIDDPTTTGISTVKGEETGVKSFDPNAPMYNLSGQRVDSSYKGIVIQNGRKVIKR